MYQLTLNIAVSNSQPVDAFEELTSRVLAQRLPDLSTPCGNVRVATLTLRANPETVAHKLCGHGAVLAYANGSFSGHYNNQVHIRVQDVAGQLTAVSFMSHPSPQ